MKRALSALLAAPLLLTACTNEPEPQSVADTETTTVEANTIDPADWETLSDMQNSLIDITGECDTIENDGNTGYCFNQNTLLVYALGNFDARSVSNAAINPESSSEGYVIGDDEWTVFCAVEAGEDTEHADQVCNQIHGAIDGAEWISVVREGKISTIESSIETPTETAPPEPATTFPDGTHMVGSDIQPGTYRNEGNETCYWARLSGFGGTVEDIISNGNPRGQAFVTIGADDVAFKSQLCGTWELVE